VRAIERAAGSPARLVAQGSLVVWRRSSVERFRSAMRPLAYEERTGKPSLLSAYLRVTTRLADPFGGCPRVLDTRGARALWSRRFPDIGDEQWSGGQL